MLTFWLGGKKVTFISEKSKATPGSVIREMFAMQDGMQDVISFALGEPDFTAPLHVIDAIVDSLHRGETHYTPNSGIPELKQAISDSYKQRGLSYESDEIIVGAGAISLLNIAATAVLDIGDEVLIPDPGWANYKGLFLQLGAVPVPVKIKEENGFMYDVSDLRASITDKTKLILLNSPSNPTGGVAGRSLLEEIAKLAREEDLYILTDEIYRELLWTDEPYTSIAELEGMKERTITVDGFSKTYAMTGLRLAYAAAPHDVITVMTKLLENVLSSVNEGTQWGGIAALTGDKEYTLQMKQEYASRRELITKLLNSIDGISCKSPSGAFYVFPNIKETGLSSRDFAIRLLKEKQVVVVPGSGFGEGGEGYIRLSYATSKENIQRGLLRIKEFVEELMR